MFSVLPTDFGKSLCSACLPLAFDKKARLALFLSRRLVSNNSRLHSPSMHA